MREKATISDKKDEKYKNWGCDRTHASLSATSLQSKLRNERCQRFLTICCEISFTYLLYIFYNTSFICQVHRADTSFLLSCFVITTLTKSLI